MKLSNSISFPSTSIHYMSAKLIPCFTRKTSVSANRFVLFLANQSPTFSHTVTLCSTTSGTLVPYSIHSVSSVTYPTVPCASCLIVDDVPIASMHMVVISSTDVTFDTVEYECSMLRGCYTHPTTLHLRICSPTHIEVGSQRLLNIKPSSKQYLSESNLYT